jgi:excisionase family DNA binding protein
LKELKEMKEGSGMSEAAPSGGQSGDDYVTPGEAARYLHVSPKTINRWANDGRIPCIVTLGGHRRFRRGDVDAAVRQMSARGAALSE